jgi:hypothetical protein
MNAPSPTGPLLRPEWLPLAEIVSRFHATNPFEPAWTALERAALGKRHVPGDGAWCTPDGARGVNREGIAERSGYAVGLASCHLQAGGTATPEELAVYQGAALYCVWDAFGPRLQRLIDEDGVDVSFYDDFARSHRTFLALPGLTPPEPAHLLALLYQAQRAWYFAHTRILGTSPGAAAARAAIWRANMGGDICVYAGSLHRHMDEIPVLITGETGTGKDLAAQCVGWSRYIPFDVATHRFAWKYAADYHARNLCEVPRELLESALFGHKKGSFTGAHADATGCLALSKENGSLFLDEVGEIPEHVQVKLLRPFQNREYVPLGETRPRKIHGRLIFATNKDLEMACHEGTFRADLRERMNGMRIHMPSLRQMIAEAPGELRGYVAAFVAAKIDSPPMAREWTDRVLGAIRETKIGYEWPNNLRELKNYTERYLLTAGPAPAVIAPVIAPAPESTCLPSSGILGPRAKAGEVSFEDLAQAYVTRMHVLTDQNASETGRRTGLDRRTVRRWIDPTRLARWLSGRK